MTDDPKVPNSPEKITRFEAMGFFAADYAAVENGKVYASGAFWSTLRFPIYPAVLPAMTLVAVIRIPFHENQQNHILAIEMLDSEGANLPLKIEGTFRSAPTIDHAYGEPGTVPIVVPIHGLTIERPGRYRFVLNVDNAQLASYAIEATQVPAFGPAQFAGPIPE
jgi:hypothetical protein